MTYSEDSLDPALGHVDHYPGVSEVDFDTFDPSLPVSGAVVPRPPQIDICVDPKIYMNPGPATWCRPAAPLERSDDAPQQAAEEGNPGVCVVDLPESKKVRREGKRTKSRPGMLQSEVQQLYNAMSFKTWQDGRGFDTLITVSALHLGMTDDAKFAALLPSMNKAIREWLANGSDRPRYRRGRSYRRVKSSRHHYLYVLERGRQHGLHVHELCVVPPELQADLRLFLTNWWQKKACVAVPKNAVNVKFAYSTNPMRQYERQQFWFRYLIKTMNPHLMVRDNRGAYRSAVDIMKPLWRFRMKPEILPIACSQLYGISRNLDKAEQERSGFWSKLDVRRLEELYNGSEVKAGLIRAIGIPGMGF